MDLCSFADIETSFDATIARICGDQYIDPICSTSNWIAPVASAFSSRAQQRVYASDAGYVVLLEHDTPTGAVLSGFDAVWGFATPLIGDDPTVLVDGLMRVLGGLDYTMLTISGLHPASALFDEVQGIGPMGYTDTADRCVADLSAGFDAWLGRRSTRFRRSLRAAANRGEQAGITIEHVAPNNEADVDAVFARLLAIEETSWKTDVNSGLVGTQLGVFTRAMAERFAATQSLRLQFAVLDGVDIGYVIGARLGSRYRGFQHSFNQNYPELSIGKLLQFHTIAAVAAEGVHAYDMGMHMTYKESYADRLESTVTAVIPSGEPLAKNCRGEPQAVSRLAKNCRGDLQAVSRSPKNCRGGAKCEQGRNRCETLLAKGITSPFAGFPVSYPRRFVGRAITEQAILYRQVRLTMRTRAPIHRVLSALTLVVAMFATILLSAPPADAQGTEVTAEYLLFNTGLGNPSTTVRTAVLDDVDLIRGNNTNERVRIPATNISLFNNGEFSARVTFGDGTVLSNVQTLYSRSNSNFGGTSRRYLLDQGALGGRSLADVTAVELVRSQGSNLNWDDFGFRETPIPPPNDAPRPVGDGYVVRSGQTLTVSAADGLLANDSDPDGDPLTVSIRRDLNANTAFFNLNPDGSFTFQARPGFTGWFDEGISVSDGRDSTSTSVRFIVQPASPTNNAAPIANDDAYWGIAGQQSGATQPVIAWLGYNDVYAQPEILSYELITQTPGLMSSLIRAGVSE